MVSFTRYCRIISPSAFVNSFSSMTSKSSASYLACCVIGLDFLFMSSLFMFGIEWHLIVGSAFISQLDVHSKRCLQGSCQ